MTNDEPAPVSRASFDVTPRPGGNERVMVLLALSGGGSRAAYFSGAVMLELEAAGLLQEVDAISSVSGGSLAAAYYCTTRDEGDRLSDAPRVWSDAEVRDLMSRNYIAHWVGNQFWPYNIARYWTTAYDRSDIMAQTLADNLYDSPVNGIDLDLGELDPERPFLIINATNATSNPLSESDADPSAGPKQYGSVVTFTSEDFTRLLGSDINNYSVARAVMGSATFPAVFQDMTLRDFRTDRKRFMHIFDGGSADNLGLVSVKRLICQAESWPPERRPDRYVVICVDAYTVPRGADPDDADPRSFTDRIVDSNFMDSIDALLTLSRWGVLSEFIATPAELEKLRQQEIDSSPVAQGKGAAGEMPDGSLQEWMAAEQLNVPAVSPVVAPDAKYAHDEDGLLAGTEADHDVLAADVQAAGESRPQPHSCADTGWQPNHLGRRLLFWHIEFADLQNAEVRKAVNKIRTDFRLPEGATVSLDAAATELVTDRVDKLEEVRAALRPPPRP